MSDNKFKFYISIAYVDNLRLSHHLYRTTDKSLESAVFRIVNDIEKTEKINLDDCESVNIIWISIDGKKGHVDWNREKIEIAGLYAEANK